MEDAPGFTRLDVRIIQSHNKMAALGMFIPWESKLRIPPDAARVGMQPLPRGSDTSTRPTVPIKNIDPENRVQHACTRASRIILVRVRNVLAC